MKQKHLSEILIACSVVFIFTSCDKNDNIDSPSTPAVTQWVSQPYDTAAAAEGRVWRSEDHWVAQQQTDGTAQPQIRGYSVTLTNLGDNRFRSEVFVTEGFHYIRFFEDQKVYRYRLDCPSEGDTLLYVFPDDSSDNPDSSTGETFVAKQISESWVKIWTTIGLDDEGIDQFNFKRITVEPSKKLLVQ